MNPISYEQATAMPRIFMAIQGAPGEGKTVAALTFPEPILLSFDDNLPNKDTLASLGVDLAKIQIIPWSNAEWVDEYNKKVAKMSDPRTRFQGVKGPPNVKDGFVHWIENTVFTLSKTATIILDSWTAMHVAFDRERSFVAPFTDISEKGGKFDPRPFWGDKLKYSIKIMDALKSIPQNVIVVYHEKKQYDEKTGQLVDKIAPLQEGQFIAQIPRFYPDYYRQVTKIKIGKDGKAVRSPDGKANEVEYLWQIRNDDVVNCRSRLRTDKTFVPACYQSLVEYGLIQDSSKQQTTLT